ncbi:MAG: hypothetical protein HC806_10365 [Anaerolineae bacterium]|nr:hypothetical protein [Anaerolineae bacterium]
MLALFGTAVLAEFLVNGDPWKGMLAVGLFTTMMATHHAVVLFVPFVIGATTIRILTNEKLNFSSLFTRLLAFGFVSILTGFLVIWPFWEWGGAQEIQTPIDHLSRHNFLTEPLASQLFFLPMYGLLIPFIPLAFRISLKKRYWGIGGSLFCLFILGLGGTTPIPKWIFGSGWEWLTFDRFAFWASICLLPFFGLSIAYLLRQEKKRKTWMFFKGGMILTALIIGIIPTWLPTQPKPIDMQPIVKFLEEENHTPYRYLTFGFGDQFALLSRLTNSTTLDGSYHTARTLPELRQSGIGQIDTSFWLPGGLDALDPILQKSSAHGVRWGFVALNVYEPVLVRNGWERLVTLSNGIEVWENPDSGFPPEVTAPQTSPFKSFSWGFFPVFIFFVTSLFATRTYWGSVFQKVLSILQSISIGLLPIGFTFWYYRTLFIFKHDRVYFTYSDALFFLSDGLSLLVIFIWWLGNQSSRKLEYLQKEGSHLKRWFFGLKHG